MKAKHDMLQKIKKMMMDEEGEEVGKKMEGMKKVTVAAPDDESLEEGLSKAQEILKARKESVE